MDDWFSPVDAPDEVKRLFLVDSVAHRRAQYLRAKAAGRL